MHRGDVIPKNVNATVVTIIKVLSNVYNYNSNNKNTIRYFPINISISICAIILTKISNIDIFNLSISYKSNGIKTFLIVIIYRIIRFIKIILAVTFNFIKKTLIFITL